MPKEIFDQERPRSAKARRFDEAFAGCEVWTTAPPPQRSRETDLSPFSPSASRIRGNAAAVRAQEPRAL